MIAEQSRRECEEAHSVLRGLPKFSDAKLEMSLGSFEPWGIVRPVDLPGLGEGTEALGHKDPTTRRARHLEAVAWRT